MTVLRAIRVTAVALTLALGASSASAGRDTVQARYDIRLDEATPTIAQVTLTAPSDTLVLARSGSADAITDIACSKRPLRLARGQVVVPAGCQMLSWRMRLAAGDDGIDASAPPSAWMTHGRFWFVAERHGFLRSSQSAGPATVRIVARWRDGRRTIRTLAFPALDEPPFYAVIGDRPTMVYRAAGFSMPIWGDAPDIPGLHALHSQALTALARLRRDAVPIANAAPASLDFAWLPPPRVIEPGYTASAGATAIGAQVVLRPSDRDATTKARAVIASSAVHEGFHAIIGTTGRGWQAWMNESLANHFAMTAAHTFLAPAERAFLERVYSDDGLTTPILVAQRAYDRDPDAARDIFYRRGPPFWRAIDAVLTNAPNGSGRLAALLRTSDGLRGVDTGNADALATFLDRYSDGRAGPIVRCHLEGKDCRAR